MTALGPPDPDPTALIVAGRALQPPPGLDLRNFLDPQVLRFNGAPRAGQPVTELILHESVTRSVSATVGVLARRGLGVHLIVAPDGRVTQHAHLADTRLAHAGGHNGPSVGLEVVNPYYPHLLRRDLPWTRSIAAPWAHRGAYVLPTPAQAEATAQLLGWLTSPATEGLTIPRSWIGLSDGQLRLGRVPGADQRRPGVYAHHHFEHADGAWLALYAWLRLEARLDPDPAYEEATRRATDARRSIDVSDLLRSSAHR